jgi:hypothetical protein
MLEKFTGPAFPFSFEVDGEHRWAHGASLRDYAAIELAKAYVKYHDDVDAVAEKAYAMADALAKASVPQQVTE